MILVIRLLHPNVKSNLRILIVHKMPDIKIRERKTLVPKMNNEYKIVETGRKVIVDTY